MQLILDILPDVLKLWKSVLPSMLRVFRGKSLDTVVMDVACDGPGGYKQWKESAGEDGRIRLQNGEPGRYLVMARR